MLDRLSIRAKLTVAFAAALVLVLVLAAAFVYLRVNASLNESIDSNLEVRSDDLSASVTEAGARAPQLPAGGSATEEGFSQILGPKGKVVATSLSDPLAGRQITRDEFERATQGPVFSRSARCPGSRGRPGSWRARCPRSPVVRRGRRGLDEDRGETLDGLLGAFAVGAPLALLLASGLGYLLAGRALAPVEAMRRRAAEITLERSGERLPLPGPTTRSTSSGRR